MFYVVISFYISKIFQNLQYKTWHEWMFWLQKATPYMIFKDRCDLNNAFKNATAYLFTNLRTYSCVFSICFQSIHKRVRFPRQHYIKYLRHVTFSAISRGWGWGGGKGGTVDDQCIWIGTYSWKPPFKNSWSRLDIDHHL